MMDFGGALKRRIPEVGLNGKVGYKKFKPEMDSLSTGIGNKLKPCTKFFSTSISSPPAVKTRLCNKYNTAEGCKYGNKCHFAHGECELGKPTAPSYEGPRSKISNSRMEAAPPSHGVAKASFGASSTANISVDASLAGAIIGKNGVKTKQIYHATGAKLSIRDHESKPDLRNIELKGTFDQIMQASDMVCELISNIDSAAANSMKNHESEQLNLRNIEPEGTFDLVKQASVLGKPTALSYEEPRSKISASRMEVPPPSHGQAASFGASSNAKISADASLSGAIIGKNCVYSKQICRVTGANLSIRDHESDQPNLRNIVLEGTFDQIKQASVIGKPTAPSYEEPRSKISASKIISNIDSAAGNPMKNHGMGHSTPASNFKTKLCENFIFTKGSCIYGERCCFAHGAEELRKPGI